MSSADSRALLLRAVLALKARGVSAVRGLAREPMTKPRVCARLRAFDGRPRPVEIIPESVANGALIARSTRPGGACQRAATVTRGFHVAPFAARLASTAARKSACRSRAG